MHKIIEIVVYERALGSLYEQNWPARLSALTFVRHRDVLRRFLVAGWKRLYGVIWIFL